MAGRRDLGILQRAEAVESVIREHPGRRADNGTLKELPRVAPLGEQCLEYRAAAPTERDGVTVAAPFRADRAIENALCLR